MPYRARGGLKLKIKPGTNIQGLNIVMRPVLIAAERVWQNYGQELVVTCGMEGEHSAGSLHYYGLAVDLRSNYFTKHPDGLHEDFDVAKDLRVELGDDFDVVVHGTHIHVEYDPERL